MQFSLLALTTLVASAAAQYYNGTTNATTTDYTTKTVTAYTTFCPAATTITHGTVTYTATASQTLTITNCPCTIVQPVVTSKVVICNTCTSAPPTYTNGTKATTAPYTPAGTLNVIATSNPVPPAPITASSGNQILAFSGASLAALVGVAAFVL